jgi:hypothetical protein
MRPQLISLLGTVLLESPPVASCALALPSGPCSTITGATTTPSLSSIDLVIGLALLENFLLVLGLALGAEGRGALLATIRGALNRRLRVSLNTPVLIARNLLWPTLIFLSVFCLATAARGIQSYLHLFSDSRTCHDAASCGGGEVLQVVASQLAAHQLYSSAAIATATLILAAMALFLGLGTLLFRWRVVENSLRFLGWVCFSLLLTLWLFSLALWAFNVLVIMTGVSRREPFWQPNATTLISLASLVIYLVVLFVRRSRKRMVPAPA